MMDRLVPVCAPHEPRADDTTVVHLIHVRKTGGTALRHAFDAHPRTERYRIVHHGHGTLLRDVPVAEKAIFFLRDPVARFVSGFYCRQRMGQPRYTSPWTAGERAAFERFHTPNDLASTLSSTDETEKSLAQDAMRAIRHLCSVFTWLESEAFLRSRLPDIFYIGFQETLEQDFERLKHKLGLPPDLRLSEDETLAHRRPAHLDGRLDDVAIANLQAWYEADQKIIDVCRRLSVQINQR
jgi:Sulfotransferase family